MTTERGAVRFGNTDIEYAVRRSRRRKKTVQITVDGEGVLVSAPVDTPADKLRAIVRKRAAWILRQRRDDAPRPAPKRFVSGETMPYLGRNVKLIVETASGDGDGAAPNLRFDHWRFRLDMPEGLEGDARRQTARREFERWYRRRAEERLPAGVRRWWNRLGNGGEPKVLIRDQRQRWGSCAPDGTLRFNWRVVMLEPALVEYVIVHELSHLTVNNHSDDFRWLMASILPDAERRRRRLRDAGLTLPF